MAHKEDGEKGKWKINIPEGYEDKTKEKRTKSRQTRKKPSKRFLDTMQMLKHEEAGATDEAGKQTMNIKKKRGGNDYIIMKNTRRQ